MVGDFIGSYVILNYLVGVVSGNKKVVVGNIGGLCDYLIEMLMFV